MGKAIILTTNRKPMLEVCEETLKNWNQVKILYATDYSEFHYKDSSWYKGNSTVSIK